MDSVLHTAGPVPATAGRDRTRLTDHAEGRPLELFYYHRPGGNFGDDLNPWLWGRLAPGLFAGGPAVFVGIGSILDGRLDKFADRPVVVFGSGVRSAATAPAVGPNWDVRFVRGPRSAKALGGVRFVTDPALCLRLVDLGPEPPRRHVALMTHIASEKLEGTWRAIAAACGYHYLSPADPLETTLTAIRASRLVVTEAMHGAIVADAFGVPWVRLRRTDAAEGPGVSEFKWADWMESLGLTHQPLDVPNLWSGGGIRGRLRRAAKVPLVMARLLRGVSARASLSDEAVRRDKLAVLREELDKVVAGYGGGR